LNSGTWPTTEIELFEEHVAALDELQQQFQGFVNELPQQNAEELINRAKSGIQ
jgi:hypothetical protein